MRRYKFQALVTLRPAAARAGLGSSLGPSPRRLVLRTTGHRAGPDAGPGWPRLFAVLVNRDDEAAAGPGNDRVLVTLRVSGEDVTDFLGIGDRFHLWDGEDIAEGVISRRLYTWPT